MRKKIHRRGKRVTKLGLAREIDATDWLATAQSFREMRLRLGTPMNAKSMIEEGRRQ